MITENDLHCQLQSLQNETHLTVGEVMLGTSQLEIKGYTNANKPNFKEFFAEIVFADDASEHASDTLNELNDYF